MSHVSRRAGQAGFSMVEMLVAMAVFAILALVVTQSLSGVMHWYGKAVTAHRLASLQDNLTQAYSENMVTAEGQSGAIIGLSSGTLAPTTNTSGKRCAATATTFAAAGAYLDASTSNAFLDGYSGAFCVFVTPQQSFVSGGVTLYYHSLAVVSMGASGYLNASTSFSSTGTLVLGGDNQGIVVDGRTAALRQFGATRMRLGNIISALQSYFLGRFQASSSPSTTVDYFGTVSGSSVWDTAGALPVTTSAAMITSASYYQTLGLSAQDVTDPYGQPFYFDNSSAAVRSPANSSSSMNSAPPWTARVSTTLPGSVTYVQSAVGTY